MTWRVRIVSTGLVILALIVGGMRAPLASAAVEVGGSAVVVTTEGDTLALRSDPGVNFPVLAALPAGTTVNVLAGPQSSPDGLQWYQVRYGELTGWCWADYLNSPQLASSAPPPAPVAAPPASAVTMRVNNTSGSGSRLRAEPNLSAAVLVVVPNGETVTVTGPTQSRDGYEWAPVQYGAQSGWMATFALVPDEAAPAAPPPAPPAPPAPPTPPPAPATAALAPGDRAIVGNTDGYNLRIRGEVGTDAPVIAYVSPGTVLLVTTTARQDKNNADWYGIEYDSLKGWVLGEHLSRTDAPLTKRASAPPALPASPPVAATPPGAGASAASPERGLAVATEALRYFGVRYVYGGATPAGWDCSGFVSYVYKQLGVSLPRTTQEQFTVGTPVSANAIKAGDIVFFSDTAGPGISHNGLALGDGRFIHAASEASGTIISSLADPYWSKHFAGARRP